MFSIRSGFSAPLAASAALFVGLPAAGPAAPTNATLVADIAQVIPAPSNTFQAFALQPKTLPATLGNFTYFYGDDGIHGRELWRSDGTPAGTAMILDLCPGRCGATGAQSDFNLAVAGPRVFFAADDGVHGQELWVISAENAAPALVADLEPGARGSSPSRFQPVGDRLFFLASDAVEGRDLWTSDGTPQGTKRVGDLVPGPASFSYQATADLGGVLIFGAWTPLHGLWRSDGTPEGTYQISAVQPWQNSWPQGAPFRVLGGRLLFYGHAPGTSPEIFASLWATDGTAEGTSEIWPMESPWNLTICGSWAYFSAGDLPREVFRTQGTAESTVKVPTPADLTMPGPFGRQACAGSSFVLAGTNETYGTEPWIASETGLTLLADIAPGPASSLELSYLDLWAGTGPFLATIGDALLLLANDGIHGSEPWISDGTPQGTHLVTDSIPGPLGISLSEGSQPIPRAVVGSAMLYRERALDGRIRVWRTDGTAPGTFPVADLEAQTSSVVPPIEPFGIWSPLGVSCMRPAGEGLLFAANDGAVGTELWYTSARTGQTDLLLDLTPGPSGGEPVGCHPYSGRSVFAGFSESYQGNAQLASVDPLTHDVSLLADGFDLLGPSLDAKQFGEHLYLGSGALWRTTGIASGTELIAPVSGNPIEISVAASSLFVGAEDLYELEPIAPSLVPLTSGYEPFHTPSRVTPLGSGLLFFATEAATGTELWQSDATAEGTDLLADLRPGPESSIVEDFYSPHRAALTRLVPLGPIALFAADDGVHGEELWRTDGTAAGTVMVRDLFPGAYPSAPRELVRVGDLVLFTAEDPAAGRELWVSNGTSVGTRRVVDLVPGTGSSVPQELAAIRDELWLSAWTPEFGREPWRVRRQGFGFAAERLADLAPGPLSSSPLIFRNAGADVYTVANDNVHGFELWKLRDLDLLFADDFESSGLALWASSAP